MKKSFKLISIFCLLTTLFSCNKENTFESTTPSNINNKVKFLAQTERDTNTKTSLGEIDNGITPILWTTDPADIIKVFTPNGESSDFTLEKADGSKASFIGNIANADKYYAFYPSINALSLTDDTLKFNIPSEQKYKTNNIDNRSMPMVAISDISNNLIFKNLAGILRLSISGEISINKIEIFSKNATLSGEMSIDTKSIEDTPKITMAKYTKENSIITLLFDESVPLSKDVYTNFNIVIPPTLNSDFYIKFYYGDKGQNIVKYIKASDKNNIIRSKITAMPNIHISPVKIGDYYYSDGTWSDGGLISIDKDGLNPVWTDEKPSPIKNKTIVGIVFQTNNDRISTKDKTDGYNNGYVVAVKFAHDNTKKTTWIAKYSESSPVDICRLASSWYLALDGREECLATRNSPINKPGDLPAFDAIDQFLNLPTAPTTSEWFIPTTGQLWDMAANLCGNEVAAHFKSWQTLDKDATYYCSENTETNPMEIFNQTLSKIDPSLKEDLIVNDDKHNFCSIFTIKPYDSASESYNIINIGQNNIECMCDWNNADCYVRPILAF